MIIIHEETRTIKRSFRERLNEAIQRGFVVARRSQTQLSNRYFEWCERQSPPRVFIRVRPRRRWAMVEVDCITRREPLNHWQTEMVQIILSTASRKPHTVIVGPSYACAPWIPLEYAELVGALLARVVGTVSAA